MAEQTLYTVGDTGKDLTAVCLDGTSPANLNGVSSVQARIARPKSTPILRDAAVVDAGTGQVTFDWLEGDLSVAGTYHIKFLVTYSNGDKQSYPANAGGFSFMVSSQIGV